MTYKPLDTDFPGQRQITPSLRLQREAQLVAKVCALIDLHLAEEVGWDRLVRVSGLPVARLQYLFAHHLKTTPMMYIRQRRTESR